MTRFLDPLDPILQFGQLLLVIFTIFYTIESIRTRRINRQ
ncbi:hypothetical protein F8S20_10415 [Nostoc sp. BAE]|nr:hypothetical protein [Nostoc commune BAE]